jgi:hypothetical protein
MDALLIEAEAEKRIEQSSAPDLGHVVCNFRHGILTLYGVVPNFHARYIAQKLVQGIEGIAVIDNQLVVSAKKRSPAIGSKIDVRQ